MRVCLPASAPDNPHHTVVIEGEFPIKGGVIRLIEDEHYASSFGLQWNVYAKTQLDSNNGTTIFTDRLKRLAGGLLEVFNGKLILEAGCGAGTFTDLILRNGGSVFAVDISSAVEANYANCHTFPHYAVAQGDIVNLPLPPAQFDIVFCVGVIQHTPDPEKTMTALCQHLKPGGLLIIDHYSHEYPITRTAWALRRLLVNRPANVSLRIVQALGAVLIPIHEMCLYLSKTRIKRLAQKFTDRWLRWSPMVDLQYAYPQLGKKFLRDWMILVTHDTLTDTYKHLRSNEQIAAHLAQCGMVDIKVWTGGNGVEANARKPS